MTTIDQTTTLVTFRVNVRSLEMAAVNLYKRPGLALWASKGIQT